MYSHWVPLGKEGEGIKKPEELLIHTETVGLQSLHTQEQQLQVVLAARMHTNTVRFQYASSRHADTCR